MAETVKLVDLDIDSKQVLKEVTKLQEEIKELKDNTKELESTNKLLTKGNKQSSDQYKQNSKQIEVNKAKTKALSTEYRNNQSTLSALTVSERGQLGTLQKLAIQNKKLRDETKTLDLTRKAGQQRLTQINTQLDKNNAFVKENADSMKKQKMNIGNYQSALEGLPGPLGRIVSGFQAMKKAALAFIATPIGIVIVAIAAAIGALTSFFKRSEEGQNSFIKVTKVLGAVLDKFLDVISRVGEALFNAVTKPKEAWENFKNTIKSVGAFFKNTFGNIIGGSIQVFVGSMQEGFAKIGVAWQKFKGIFTDNAEGIEKAQEKVEKANTKIEEGQEKVRKGAEFFGKTFDKTRGKLKAYSDELKRVAEIARRLADEEADLRKQERKDIVENSKLRSESAKLRAEAEKQKLIDAQKSIDLFTQSFDIDEKILENELKIAERKAENAKISASLAKSDTKTLDEIAALEAEVENKRAAFDEKRRERTRRLNAIRLEAFKQEQERLKAQIELEKIYADESIRINERILSDEKSTYDEKLEAFENNTNARLELLNKQSDIELKELETNKELSLINDEDYQLQKQLIEVKYSDESRKLLEDNLQFGIDLDNRKNEIGIENARINFENEKINQEERLNYKLGILDFEMAAELEAAEKTGADKLAIEKKYAQFRIDIEKEVQDSNLELAQGFAGDIATIFGKNTKIGRVAAVTETAINTYRGAQAAFTSLAGIPVVGPVLGAAAATATVAMGLANVKKILAVKSGLPGDSGGSAPSISSAGATSLPTTGRGIAAYSDGGLTTRSLIDTTAKSVKKGVKEAFEEAPPRTVLVVEEVTQKQGEVDRTIQTITI